MMYTHVSLFAGLGGFILAGNRNGFKTVFANEVDQSCGFTLRSNFQEVALALRDVRELITSEHTELENDIDILSAGFPCQSFSQAGDNLGFDDERGRLFFEIPRICKELNRFPKVLLLENVPFLKIFNGGSRLKVVINELRKIGYWISDSDAQILNSYDFADTPQKRERLYIVAVHSSYFRKNKFKFPEKKTSEQKSLWSYINKGEKSSDHLYLSEENKYARMIKRSANDNGSNRLFQIRRAEVRACPLDICPTLTANMGGGGHNVPFLIDDWGVRRLSVDEVMSMQCIRPVELKFPNGLVESSKLSMLGNAICVDVVDKVFKNIKSLLNDEVIINEQKTTELAFS